MEVIDSLSRIKDNLDLLVGGDIGNELAWETLELIFKYRNYFDLSTVDLPSTPEALYENIDGILFDYNGLVYSLYVEDEEVIYKSK